MCGPAPSATVVSRSMNYKRAPRDQSALAGKLERGGAFALRAGDGFDRFQCSPRTDPAPLRVLGGLRGIGRFARREARARWNFRADALGMGLIASSACFGLIPLRCGFGWAPRDQALRSQGTLGQEGLSSAIALGGQDVDVPMLAAD